MKLTYSIQQKLRLAIWLFAIMVTILITNLIAKRNIDHFDKNFQSIYNDRLIPVKDIFFVSENIHAKTLMLEHYFANNGEYPAKVLSKQLALSNKAIDSLISKYEKTYLEKEEKISLTKLKSKLKEAEGIEKAILFKIENGSDETGRMMYEAKEKSVLEATHAELQTITNLQSSIGKDLIDDSRLSIFSSELLLTIQILIVFVLGAFITSLLFASKVVGQKNEKFNLN